ncbi:MAG: Gfo/Idh/MocA family oxidoreductase [Planctomycetes bacterium]|nr:Gfo/Idh/MocA family oxidoreductase [Planctomycetota bacterium]
MTCVLCYNATLPNAQHEFTKGKTMMNVGLIGLDGHQGAVLNGIVKSDELRLAAVASERQDALDGMRKTKAGDEETGFYANWEELLDKETLDILAICSTNEQHAAQIQAGAERGLHLCSEKPLTTTLDDLAETRAAVEKAGVKLTMLLTMRFTPPYLCVKRIVESGVLGEVCLATAQKSYKLGARPEWQRCRMSFGGTIPFVGIHGMDLIRWTSGREFVECMAYHANTGHPDIRDMEDQASVLLKLDNGGSATMRIDYCRPSTADTHGDDRLRLAGSQGVVEVMSGEVTLITEADGPTQPEMPPEQDLFLDFVASIKGEKEHLIPAEDCFRMTEVVLRARDAADGGRIVRL